MPLQTPPAKLTPEQLYALLVAIDSKQGQIVRDVTIVRERVEQVEEDQRDLLAAWRAGGAVLRVVKWASSVGAGVAAIWAFISTRL
jgi:hypothetical protein